MQKNNIRIIVGVIVGVIFAYYAGAMMNFFPFIGDDLLMREIGFCTLIICTVIAICTCIIISNDKDKKDKSE